MGWVEYIFGSGLAFFLGVGLILSGVGLAALGDLRRRQISGRASSSQWLRARAISAVVFGTVFVALSAAPLPYWFYAVGAAAVIAWLVGGNSARPVVRDWTRTALVACCMLGLVMEFPYHRSPSIDFSAKPNVYVIGDSVSSGIGQEKEAWPAILARLEEIDVENLARGGATASTAMSQAERIPAHGSVVLIEIGGNDLLGTTSAARFERDLDELLSRVATPGREVFLFELPLPPFRNEYGRIQRRLAEKHGARLIPKRLFMDVLTASGATSDGIHLTDGGQRAMADAIRALVLPPSTASK